MDAPALLNNQFSVLVVENLTGIVLKTDFEQYTGEGELYHVFNNEKVALKFINENLLKFKSFDFSIYNSNGEYLYTINKDNCSIN
jgi:hypothetical protein